MNINNIILTANKGKNYPKFYFTYNNNIVKLELDKGIIVDKKNNSIHIDISNSNLINIIKDINCNYLPLLKIKNKYNYNYDDIINNNIIKVYCNNSTSIILNKQNIEFNELKLNTNITGTIVLHFLYIHNNTIRIILKATDIVINNILTTDTIVPIEFIEDNKNSGINAKKLMTLLEDSDSNNNNMNKINEMLNTTSSNKEKSSEKIRNFLTKKLT